MYTLNDKELILGIGVTLLSLGDVVGKVCQIIEGEEKQKVIVTANPHSIILSRRDKEFSQALNRADICLPDGAGVVMASKLLGGSIRERIAGPDLFTVFCEFAHRNSRHLRYFFIGSSDETLRKISEKMAIDYPNIRLTGLYSPPFGEWTEGEDEKIIDMVNDSGADILWVGLGAPKQEKWIYQNRDRLNVNVIAAIGAAFDFFAGTKRRSPRFFRNIGLEWLPRFFLEPRRLWRRNLVSMPRFIALVLGEFILKKRGRDK